jgi:DNA polymerase-3 subunit epsilon
MHNLNLAIVDVETTGGFAENDRIIEIGIIRVEKGKMVEKYNTLIDPEQYLSPFITNLTGITDKHLQKAPTFISVRENISELLNNAIFVAHNAHFDYGFVKHEFKRLGDRWEAERLCTVQLSRHLYPEHRHHNLDSVIERCNIKCESRHRALDDAKAVWDFLKHSEKNFSKIALENAFKKLIR